MLGGQGRVQGLGAVGVAELIRVRAQFGRPGQQGREDVEFVRVGRARQDADAPQARGAKGASFGQAAFGLLSGERAAPLVVATEDLQLGAQSSGLGVEQVGGLGHDQPAERPAHQRDQRGLEHPGSVARFRLVCWGLRPGRAWGPDQPVQVIEGALRRLGLGPRREQQRPTRRCQ
jgi:hypothetical protein